MTIHDLLMILNFTWYLKTIDTKQKIKNDCKGATKLRQFLILVPHIYR